MQTKFIYPCVLVTRLDIVDKMDKQNTYKPTVIYDGFLNTSVNVKEEDLSLSVSSSKLDPDPDPSLRL